MPSPDRCVGPVDQELRAWVAGLGQAKTQFDVDEVRAQGRARALARLREPDVASVRDRSIGVRSRTLEVRAYEPADAGARPIVYLHRALLSALPLPSGIYNVCRDNERVPKHRFTRAAGWHPRQQ
jgi:hypothetical protein